MIRVFFFLTLIIISSCSNDRELPDESCQEIFLYETISLTPVTGVVMVEFKDFENIETQIQSLFSTYEFLDEELFPIGNFSNRVPFWLKSQSCKALYESLIILNEDESISAATPILRPQGPGIQDSSPWTLVNRVSIHPNSEEGIPEILEWANENGLEWEGSTGLTQRFVVKDVRTGFEPLEIATKAKNELSVRWADADFIVPINRWP
ncbi:hypothetical protein [Aquiflexum sp.]|uniref:hypothetical protein n=1 Tax=Aquiflexum sp. TaxID=1872584 RepID=UPI003593D6E6